MKPLAFDYVELPILSCEIGMLFAPQKWPDLHNNRTNPTEHPGIRRIGSAGGFMPIYYFDVKNGRRVVDGVGISCVDDKAASATADFKATQIGINTPCNHERHVAVLNANGDEIFKSPVRIKPAA